MADERPTEVHEVAVEVHEMGPFTGPGFRTPAAPDLQKSETELRFRCPICDTEYLSRDLFGPACDGGPGTARHDPAPCERVEEEGVPLEAPSPFIYSLPPPDLPEAGEGTLSRLAEVHKTDKWGAVHAYTLHYERLFAHLKDEPITLLELGVFMGASLRMWRDWFPNATVVGLDNEDKREYEQDRVHVVVGDQDDPGVARYLGEVWGPFDIVVDDASHLGHQTVRSFELLRDHMTPRGIYCVEDLQVCYTRDGIMEYWQVEYFKRLVDQMTMGRPGPGIESVSFYRGLCVVQFGDNL